MESPELVLELLAFSHTVIESRVDVFPPGQLFLGQPGSGVVCAAAIYAHAVLDEDHFVSNRIGEPLLFESGGWKSRLDFEPLAEIRTAWAESLRFDIEAMREYAVRVYSRSYAFLATLDAAGQAPLVPNWQPIRAGNELRFVERQMPLLFAFMDNVTLHTIEHAGEIAILTNLAAVSR